MTAFDAHYPTPSDGDSAFNLIDDSSQFSSSTKVFEDSYAEVAPQFQENDNATERFIPRFEIAFDKFDYNKDSLLSKEEVQQASADESLRPHEQQMAQILNDNYEIIEPMGATSGRDFDKLAKSDMVALDALGEDGVGFRLSYNYSNSTGWKYFLRETDAGLREIAKVEVRSPGDLLEIGFRMSGAGAAGIVCGLYGMGKGVHDYYNAKPDFERIRNEIRDLPSS